VIRKTVIIVVVLLACVMAFYAVFNNPFLITGYYYAETSGSGGEEGPYVLLSGDKITIIDESDYSSMIEVDVEYLDSDRPEYGYRLRMEGGDVYMNKSLLELTHHSDDRPGDFTMKRIFNPVLLVRLTYSRLMSDE